MSDLDILKQLDKRMTEGFASTKELLTKSEDMNKERMIDIKRSMENIKHSMEDYDKRIRKLEASNSFNAGKIAGISAAISTILTLAAFFIKGGA